MRRALVVLGLLAAGVVVVTAPWIPPICPMRLLLHVPCPSCGLTRAARAVLHGDFGEAFHLHPLFVVVFPYLGALFALEATDYVRLGTTGRWLRMAWVERAGAVLLVMLVVVWVVRGLGGLGGPVPIE